MKLNTLFVASVCAGALLASCNPKTANENQLKFTHTSLVDGDAFQFFQLVGAKVAYEVDQATYVAGVATSPQAKEVAAKVKDVYGSLLSTLDSLATSNQVDFPIKGAAPFVAPQAGGAIVETLADSTSAPVASVAFSDEGYVHHVQHEAAIIKDQFDRLSRNTNKGLRDFAQANLKKVNEVFTLAGGKEDAHAHH